MLEDAEIKHDACVMHSIIGWSSRVGAWARVEGTPIPMTSHSTSIIKHGIKVQSITILGKECAVGDEVRVQNCVCLPYKELKRVCYLALLHFLTTLTLVNRMLPTRLLCSETFKKDCSKLDLFDGLYIFLVTTNPFDSSINTLYSKPFSWTLDNVDHLGARTAIILV